MVAQGKKGTNGTVDWYGNEEKKNPYVKKTKEGTNNGTR